MRSLITILRLLLHYSGWLIIVLGLAFFVPQGHWLALALLTLLLLQEKYQLRRLRAFLQAKYSDNNQLPVAYGTWGSVYDLLYTRFQEVKDKSTRYHSFMRRIQRIATRMDDGVMLLDGNMRIVWFNRAAKAIMGLRSGNQDIGMPVYHVIRQQRFSKFLSEQAESVALQIDDRQLEMRLISVADDSYMLLARDFSPQQQLERMRKDFTANISHELRTPLTVLFGYLEQLQDKSRDEDGVAIKRMVEQCQRMTKLLSDLTTLSQIELDAPEAESGEIVDVAAVLKTLESEAEILNKGYKHNISFACQSSAAILGDHSQLLSAFTNLLANAIYYTRSGGNINISWATDSFGRGLFTVQDDGIGIAERHLSRITERFFRVDNAAKGIAGAGLGLSITKHALANHDAELVVYSQEGQGSTFICRFNAASLVNAAS